MIRHAAKRNVMTLTVVLALFPNAVWAEQSLEPLVRTVDLNVGETRTVKLADGSMASVRLLDVREERDTLRNVVRRAVVIVEVNSVRTGLVAGTYRLPETVGGVQVDCAVTRGYTSNGIDNVWNLKSDARIRLWPADSPWIRPGTFTYPANQRWFASDTQMANDPCYVDGGEVPDSQPSYI